MASARTAKSIRNAKWSMILQLVMIVTKFITTTLLVKLLGDEYNGLNGLFNEVIAMMSLAEMGVGTAIVYNLYKPLAEGDTETLRRLMGLFKSAYRVIGTVMFAIGAALLPFVHLIVRKTGFDIFYIRIVFALFVTKTASTYFLAYKRSIINADQNNYAVSAVSCVYQIIVTALCAAVLFFTHNYILYLSVLVLNEIAVNITLSVYVDRRYPFLKSTTKALPEEKRSVFENIRHIFIGTLSGKVTTSTDNILISVIINTVQVGIYTNYALILNSVRNLLQRVAESITGSLGNLLATEDNDRVDLVLSRVTFMFAASGFAAAVVLYSVVTPFVRFWLGDERVMNNTVLFVCVFNVFLFIAREPLWRIVQTSGLFAIDKNISIAGTVVNLVVSVVLGKLWGMAGIFVGTTCTLVIQLVLKTIMFYKKRLLRSPVKSLVFWLKICCLTAAAMLGAGFICDKITIFGALGGCVLKAAVSGVSAILILVVFYGRTAEFDYWLNMFKGMIPGRGKKLEKI